MHFQSLALASLVALGASAQSTTTSSSSSTSSDLPSLVAKLPTCALSCFDTAATAVGCASTDFTCLCNSNNAGSLATKVGLCLGLGTSCDLTTVATVAQEICSVVNSGSVNSAQLSSASAEVTAALASVSSTATGASASSKTSTGNAAPVAARPTDMAMGAMGVAAAFAVFAL